MAIPNRYKDTSDELIDSLDVESPDQPGPIVKGSRNTLRSESSLTGLSEGDCLDKNISDRSSQLAPKTGDSKVHQRHNVIPLGLRSGRLQYGKF